MFEIGFPVGESQTDLLSGICIPERRDVHRNTYALISGNEGWLRSVSYEELGHCWLEMKRTRC